MLLQLRHRGFRNLVDAVFAPAAGGATTLLHGDNGSGKTSLLEAIYVALTTKSFRATQLTECVVRPAATIQRDEAGQRGHFELLATVLGQNEETARLAVTVAHDGGRGRTLQGKPTSLAQHLAVQPVIAWTTAERTLLVGPPAARRRFLDRGVVSEHSSTLETLGQYHRALEHKRAVLQRRRSGKELAPWNELMASHGAELARLRGEHVRRLAEELTGILALAAHPFPPIRLRYRPSPAAAEDGEQALLAALAQAQPEEERRRQPLIGPHRDDLLVQWGGSDLRGVASAGERKALGLALLAAQLRTLEARGRRPIVLLDDMDVELDRGALARTFGLFAGRQTIVSSNRPEAFEGLPIARCLHLVAGAAAQPGQEE